MIAPLFIIFAAFLWAFDGVVLRPSLYSLPVTLVVFIEHAFALVVLLPLLWYYRSELKKMKRIDWVSFGFVALFGGALGTLFITKALFYVEFVPLSVVLLIQKLQPLFALILARIWLKESLPAKFWPWATTAVGASYVLAFPELVPNFNTGPQTVYAALFALGAAFSWGSSTVFSKQALAHVNNSVGTALRFVMTTLIVGILVLATGSFRSFADVNSQHWLIFTVIVCTSGAAAMLIYYRGLKHVKASVATICELFFPLSAVVLEFFIRGVVLSPLQLIAGAVLLFSIYRVSQFQNKRLATT